MRKLFRDSAKLCVRDPGYLTWAKTNNAVIHPPYQEAMQIDEVAGDM
jgi:hypothetical protein